MKTKNLFFILTLFILILSSCGDKIVKKSRSDIRIIPRPLEVEVGDEYFLLDENTRLLYDKNNSGLEKAANELNRILAHSSNIKLNPLDTENELPSSNVIQFVLVDNEEQMGAEGYHLLVNQNNIIIEAAKPAGVFYGVQTLRQLFPIAIDDENMKAENWRIPSVEILDKPRFEWRGDMLDVSRHFLPLEFIKKNIDYLARYKMNTFHWHLTDDQGWRIEIKNYTKLTDVGAWRVDRNDEPWWGREPQQPGEATTYGGFYTQNEISEIVQYAADRFITVVPEIDMPGHSQATIAAYPEISCNGKPYFVATGGVAKDNTLCPGKDITFEFIEKMLDEVFILFPSEYFHVGGDECNKSQWEKCPDCQQRIKDEGLKDEHELQSYFIKRVEKIANRKGKELIGWDEILEGRLAPNAAVMSWRGEDGGLAAAKMKHDVIMTPSAYCYLDLKQGNPELEPELGYSECKLSTAYSYDPVPSELSEEEAKHILGSQGNLWGESIQNEEHANYMLFPRLLAIAEVTWTPKELRRWDDFVWRLESQLERLDKLNIGYAKSMYNVNIEIATVKEGETFLIELSTEHGSLPIHYTVDGTEPTSTSPIYVKPIKFTQSVVIKAGAFRDRKLISKISTHKLEVHLAAGKNITFANKWSSKYPPTANNPLTDCMKGSISFKDGNWIGFEGEDLTATIDLGKETKISDVKISCLEEQGRFIFLPKTINVYTSTDGESFNLIGSAEPNSNIKQVEKMRKEISIHIKGSAERYIKVHAENIGICPKWHKGAGGKAWLFVDEIIVE